MLPENGPGEKILRYKDEPGRMVDQGSAPWGRPGTHPFSPIPVPVPWPLNLSR